MRVSAESSSRMPQFSRSREQLCMQSQPVSRSKKTEYDIFFRIVKEQPTRSNDGTMRQRARGNPLARRTWVQPSIRRQARDGGGERDRTDDPLLAKQVLSQLSYTPVRLWWVWLGSNQRPPPYQDGALTS